MPEFAIDRAIAAVHQEIEDWEGFAEGHGGHALEQLLALRAALAILEAARAWADDLRPWVSIAIPNDSHSLVMNLYRAIQGRAP